MVWHLMRQEQLTHTVLEMQLVHQPDSARVSLAHSYATSLGHTWLNRI